MRRLDRDRRNAAYDLKSFEWLDLCDLDRKLLLEQFVPVHLVKVLDQTPRTDRTKYLQRLGSFARFRRVPHSEQKCRHAATMVKVKVRQPDRIEVRPVKMFLSHPKRRRRAEVEPYRPGRAFQPESRT